MELILFMKNREDIWKQEIRESVNFESELNEIENIQILVCNSINLYDVLGGDKYLLGDSVNREIQNEERQIERDNQNDERRKRKMKIREMNTEDFIF